jgi:hypothetical protein
VQWKRLVRGLPKGRRYADDRAPTLEEIRKTMEYPDRRIKAIIYTMASSGIRLGAWDVLKWKHVHPITKNSRVLAAKLIVYGGDYITTLKQNDLKSATTILIISFYESYYIDINSRS